MGTVNYDIIIEICQGDGCDHHAMGESYYYPDDIGKLCPWLLDSINAMIRVLQFGGTLPWTYKDTAFEKVIDQDGMTTEFIRCPDPTGAGVVAKVTCKRLKAPKTVGWA